MGESAKELQLLEVKASESAPDIRDWHIALLKEENAQFQKRLEAQRRLNLIYLKALNRAKGRVRVW